MSNNKTIIRPYAKALFLYAKESNQFSSWLETLDFASKVAKNPLVVDMLKNPGFDNPYRIQFFINICTDGLKESIQTLKGFKEFFEVLGEADRLALIPELAQIFEELVREEQKNVKVKVVSAKPLSEEQKESIYNALKRQMQSEVTLDCQVDEALMGGAIIKAGDRVIDGSVLGKLRHLKESLNVGI